MRRANLLARINARNLLFLRSKGTTLGKERYFKSSSPSIESPCLLPLTKFSNYIEESSASLESPNNQDNIVKLSMGNKKMKLDSESGKYGAARAASYASLEIISNGTTHTGPSVVLKTDKNTYIFNCPEGTCRFQSAIRLRPNTTYDFFITRGSWDCFGGVSGSLLSKADLDLSLPQECRLHGPKNIRQYLDDLRPFLDSDKGIDKYSMLMEERSYERGSYQDAILSVQYIPLMSTGSLPDQKGVDVAYLVELAKPPMRVDFLKVIELKVPPGPLIGQLKDGNAVTLPDGRTIQPEQIYADQQVDHGKPFLVADVISEEKLNCLTSASVMQKFMNGSQQLGFIVHFTPQEVFTSPRYTEWMQTFGDKCEHIVVNGSGGMKSVAPQIDSPYMQQMMLNTLDPITFPMLYPKDFDGVVTQDHGGEFPSPNIVVPTSLRRFAVRGKLPMSDLIAFTFTESGLACRINAAPEVTPLIENFLEYTKSIADREEDKYPQISFLGTSSASPTRYRNVSGHLLHLNENSFVMVDCGELTYGQIRVLYGEEECERILLNLHTVCITHAHQDHLNGLIMLIERRESAFKKHGVEYKPLILLASRRALKPLNFYSGLFRDLEKLIVAIDPNDMLKMPSDSLSDNSNKAANRMAHFPAELYSKDEWNLADIEPVKVLHVAYSYAYIFTDTRGRKVVFSGDTTPCDSLVERGRDCDILVHEATFQDLLKLDANLKKHSTMEQAVDVGCRMNAKNVILTHFSARYNKVPMLPDYLIDAGNISIAMDNMVVRFDRLDVLPKLLPIYRHIYLEELLKADEIAVRFAATRVLSQKK